MGGEAFRAWRELVDQAQRLAEEAFNAGAGGSAVWARSDFAHQLARLRKGRKGADGRFPVGGMSAEAASAAFLDLASAWAAAGYSPTLAAFVRSGALCLDRMLTDRGHELAALSRRMTGEAD